MNIAMFSDSFYPRINGVSVSVKSYAEALTNLGHNVCIVCCDYDESTLLDLRAKGYYDHNPEIDSRIKILRISSFNVFVSEEDKSAKLTAWRIVKHEMDDFKPDVIHINTEFIIGWFGLTYAKHRGIPKVYTFHTMWEDYVDGYIHFMPAYPAKKIAKELIKFYLKRVDLIITPTQRIADVVKAYKIERVPKILPTGIPNNNGEIKKEYKKLYYNQLHKLFPVVQKKHILLYVGRVVKEKNIEFLFPVLFTVKKIIPDTMLIIVGGGPELEHLKEKAKKLHCNKDVIFTGYRTKDELSYFYHTADVFVFPSKTETQGLVTLEAMMAGLPVVAIGEMGTIDVMQGDNGGFMVKDDAAIFAEKVIDLLQDKQLYAKKVQEARDWAEKWSLKALTPKLVSYYEEAIELHKKQK